MKLTWKGAQVTGHVYTRVKRFLVLFGLAAEGKSKQVLKASERIRVKGRVVWVRGGGHGVRTGTLRRSIHLAPPGYNWAGDDVEANKGTPERGGAEPEPGTIGKRISLSLGSGLRYAMPVHEGHGSFSGHHYLTKGIEAAKPLIPMLMDKARREDSDD